MPISRSLLIFLVAALLEVGGGWLVWKWWRDQSALWMGILGALMLVGYGVVATFQPADFGRVYAAYGGVFIICSVAWAWSIDKARPDLPTVIGALISLVGAAVIMYWPRSSGV